MVVEGLVLTGITAMVGLLWRLTVLTATQNGSLARVIQDLDEHRREDREDFQLLHARIDALD